MIRLSRPALVALALACNGQPLLAQPNVTATKSDGIPAATKKNPGDTVTYSHVITNSGTGAALDTQFVDPNVAGASVVASSIKVSPLAIDDSYPLTVLANTRIQTDTDSEFSVTANDYVGMAAGAAASITITSFSPTSVNGGIVTMVTSGANMGKFTYAPAPGFTGPDSFTYTITNSASYSHTGTVSLTVSGPVVWFVNAATGNDTTGNGTMDQPFATVNKAATVDAASHRIYVAAGSYSGTAIALETNEILIGQGAAGSSFDALAFGGTTPSPDTAARPSIGGTKPVITRSSGGNTIALGQNNVIQGLSITNTGGGFALHGTSINTAQIGSAATSDVDLGSSGTSSGAVNLSGGNGSISINAPITTTSGRSVMIANRSGSAVAFTQAIADSAMGISLTNNTGASISFSAGLALNTGANPAFTATGGGTVTATQDNVTIVNTLTTTTSTALNVVNSTIGSGGLTFRSISANGAANGIVLNTTGASGRLSVTGASSALSGGTITNTTGVGVSLNSTANVSLNKMLISNTGHNGISGSNLSDPNTGDAIPSFELRNSRLTNAGNADAEPSLYFGGPAAPAGNTGRIVIADTIIEQFEDFALSVGSSAGALTVDVSGTRSGTSPNFNSTMKFDDNNDTHGEAAIVIASQGSATVNLNVNGAYFNNVEGSGVLFQPDVPAVANDLNVIGCAFNGAGGPDNFPNSAYVVINSRDQNTVNFDVQGNDMLDCREGIVVVGDGHLMGRIGGSTPDLGNRITGVAFDAIRLDMDGVFGNVINSANFTWTVLVQNNTLTGEPGSLNQDDAIQVLNRDHVGTFNLTIENNTISDFYSEALRYFSGERNSPVLGDTNGVVRFANNQLSNTAFGPGESDLSLRTTDQATAYFDITGNTNSSGPFTINFDKSETSSQYVEQTSLANVSSLNGSSAVSNSVGAVAFNVAVNPPLPSNPLLFAPDWASRGEAPRSTAEAIAWCETEREKSLAPATVSEPGRPILPQSVADLAPASTSDLTQIQLDVLVTAARDRWSATGLSETQKAALGRLSFSVVDLPGWYLGEARGTTLCIDKDAGGNSWFIDETPHEDAEFASNAPAVGRIDLLTTVMHEMGHALGLCDSYSDQHRNSLMYGFLRKGERRLPVNGQAIGAEPHSHNEPHFLSAPIDIGAIPPGKSVTIVYDVVINDPLTSFPLSSQATVSGSNFANKLTDDIDQPGAADPTITLIERPDTTVVSLNRSSTSPSNGLAVTWEIVFAHPLDYLVSGNFSLANTGLGGAPAITSVTAVGAPPTTTWNITATTGSGDGTLGLNLPNDAGLTFDVTNRTFIGQVHTLDRTPPSATINLADSALKIGDTSLVTIEFTEAVSGFGNVDLTHPNGTLTAVTTSDNIIWTATFTPDDSISDNTNFINLDRTGITDVLGNVGAGSAVSANYAIDTIRPTTTSIVVTDDMLDIGETSLVTFTFSEAVTDFDTADLTVGNGAVSGLTSGDGGITWSATLTPTSGITDSSNLITLDNTGLTDLAGNAGTGTTDSNNYEMVGMTISIAADTASASEGSGGGNSGFYFVVSRLGSTDAAVTMDFVVSGAAVNAADFSGTLSGTVTIPATLSDVTLTIDVVRDSTVELDEAFTVTLSNPGDGVIAAPAASSTIINDDSSVVSLTGGSAAEGDSGVSNLEFTVSLTHPVDVDISVSRQSTLAGDATVATDFTALASAAFTIPAGDTSATFNLNVSGDNDVEPDETVGAAISDLSADGRAVTLGTTNALGTITNDDPLLVAANTTLTVKKGTSGKLKVQPLLALTSPVEGRPLNLLSVQNPSAANGTVVIAEGWIYYQPLTGYSGLDSFTYTITDGVQTVSGTVSVIITTETGTTPNVYKLLDEGANKRLQCLGIPGRHYQMETSENMTTWTPRDTPIVCPPTGVMSFLDVAPLPPSRFYRVVETTP